MRTTSARRQAPPSWSTGDCLPLRWRASRMASSVMFMAMSTLGAEMALRFGIQLGRRWGRSRCPVDVPVSALERRVRCLSVRSNHCGGFSWRTRQKGRYWEYDGFGQSSELSLLPLRMACGTTLWHRPFAIGFVHRQEGNLITSAPGCGITRYLCTLISTSRHNHAS